MNDLVSDENNPTFLFQLLSLHIYLHLQSIFVISNILENKIVRKKLKKNYSEATLTIYRVRSYHIFGRFLKMSGNSEDSSLPMPIDPLNKDPFDQTSTLEKMDGYTIPKKVLDILDKADEKKQGDEKLIKTKKISRQSANDFLADDDSDGDSSMKDLEKSDGSKNVQDEEEMKDLEISDGSKNVQDEEETKVEVYKIKQKIKSQLRKFLFSVLTLIVF